MILWHLGELYPIFPFLCWDITATQTTFNRFRTRRNIRQVCWDSLWLYPKLSLPIYIFHLFIRYIIEQYGFPNPNPIVYYSCIFGLGTLCVLVFSSKPFATAYDKLMDFFYRILPL